MPELATGGGPAAPARPVTIRARARGALPGEQGRWSALALWLGVPLVITVLCWRALPLEPNHGEGVGLATSWEGALHMALHQDITFGKHLVFTYGPLGFVSAPTLWYGDTGTIAVLYTGLLRFLLALALFAGARRSYGTLVGALVAVILADASEFALETVPFLVLAVWMVDRPRAGVRQRLALLALAGAVAGVELLNKESVGVEMAALAAIVALAAGGRRALQLLVTLLALLVAFAIGWTLSAQDWGSLSAYAQNSAQIISGYSAAMSYEDPSLVWEYGAALLAFAFGIAGAVKMTEDGPFSRRWGIIALWVVFCFFEYKEGFVRHFADHGAIYFVALMGGLLAMRWRWGGNRVGLALLALLFVFAVAAQGKEFIAVADPFANAAKAVSQAVEVLSPSESAAITTRGRRSLQASYPIDQQTLSLLQGHTVHVTPYATSVVWAYRLKWSPLPVFQSYAAYTAKLDQLDAEDLESTRAPQRILRDHDHEIDGRVEAFDEGLTSRTILCRYRELRTTELWQVLGLGPNRCGTAVALGTVHAAWNEQVPVPALPNDHSIVFARIGGVGVEGLEAVVGLLFKPADRFIHLNHVSHRLIGATAADGLLLRAPAAMDFSGGFKLAPDSSQIAIGKSGQGSGPVKSLSISFFAQAITSSPRASAHTTP